MTCRHLWGFLLIAALLGAGGGEHTTVVRIPLEDGRLNVQDVLETLCLEAGVDPGEMLEGVDWSIDLGSALGRLQLRVFDRLMPGALHTEILDDAVVVTIDRQRLADAVKPPPAARRVGMTVVTPGDPRAPIAALPAGVTRAVVLLPGLDDPGWMFRDLIPPLVDRGFVVIRFDYANDQPIADSADLLARALERLRELGIERIDLVAHSMGGLVARDVLTRSVYYAGDGGGGDRYPAAARLIMLGPPNHGTPMARLRGIIEVRQQLARWLAGSGGIIDALTDGAGEAGRDLLPHSDFLRRLNARPLPSHTKITIVTGRLSPLGADDVDELIRSWRRFAGTEDDVGTSHVTNLLVHLVDGLGDGVVSDKSAQLDGVTDVVTVKASHLSMLVNIGPGRAAPPAVPIVLDRLGGRASR